MRLNKDGTFSPENTVNAEIDNGHAAIGGALIDCLYLHHERLAEVFRFFDKDNRFVIIIIVVVLNCTIIVLQYIEFNMVGLRWMAWHCIVLHWIVLYCIVLYCIVL